MLLLSFNLGKDRYVIDSTAIVEVLPYVDLKHIPNSPDCVAGILNYHGRAVPIIDINQLCRDTPSSETLTTRIILVKYQSEHLLGLVAEGITETMRIDKDNFVSAGINISTHNFLGDVSEEDGYFVQLVKTDQLLSDEIRALLFKDTDMAVGG